jgi:hypothetical protein
VLQLDTGVALAGLLRLVLNPQVIGEKSKSTKVDSGWETFQGQQRESLQGFAG